MASPSAEQRDARRGVLRWFLVPPPPHHPLHFVQSTSLFGTAEWVCMPLVWDTFQVRRQLKIVVAYTNAEVSSPSPSPSPWSESEGGVCGWVCKAAASTNPPKLYPDERPPETGRAHQPKKGELDCKDITWPRGSCPSSVVCHLWSLRRQQLTPSAQRDGVASKWSSVVFGTFLRFIFKNDQRSGVTGILLTNSIASSLAMNTGTVRRTRHSPSSPRPVYGNSDRSCTALIGASAAWSSQR